MEIYYLTYRRMFVFRESSGESCHFVSRRGADRAENGKVPRVIFRFRDPSKFVLCFLPPFLLQNMKDIYKNKFIKAAQQFTVSRFYYMMP